MPAPGTITAERELELIAFAQDVLGRFPSDSLGTAAMNEVVVANLGLVSQVVRFVGDQRRFSIVEDFHLGSYTALCKAVLNFDVSLGTKFSTYAVWKLRGELGIVIRKSQIPEISNMGFNSRGDFDDDDNQPDFWSFWTQVFSKEDERDSIEVCEYKRIFSILNYWRDLPRFSRLALILRLRYGLDGRPYRMEEIGVELNVSKERVRQLLADAERFFRDAYLSPEKFGETPKEEGQLASA